MSQVIVYTTDTCPYCTLMIDFLQREGIPYEERNVSKQPRYVQELVELGTAGVPTSVVNGQTVIGYQPDTIKRLASMGTTGA